MDNYLLFDIGGTYVKYGVINESHTFLFKSMFDSKAAVDGILILDDIIETALPLIKQYNIKGIAISSAGVINPYTGVVLSTTATFKNYAGINIVSYLASKLNLPITVENDVNCMALCEFHFANQVDNALFLTVGTGIGGAIFVNGDLVRGHRFSAGEIGSMLINDVAFETVCSTAALTSKVNNHYPELKTGVDVFSAYDNPQIKPFILEFYQNLGKGIANLIYILNPEAVVIGGGISNRPTFIDELTPHIKTHLNAHLQDTIIKVASFKNDASMIGAYLHYQTMNKKGK